MPHERLLHTGLDHGAAACGPDLQRRDAIFGAALHMLQPAALGAICVAGAAGGAAEWHELCIGMGRWSGALQAAGGASAQCNHAGGST